MTTPVVRAAAYVRVSTKDQARDGWSLEDQEQDARQLIDSREGWIYAGTYDDGGRKGDRDEQYELERLLSDASAGEVGVVVVKALDRLGRDDGEIAATLELLRDAKVRVFVGGRELDFDTPEGYLHTDIERIFAAYERRKIRARTRAGLRQRKRSGKPVGPIPLGYTWEEFEVDGRTTTRRVIDPVTSSVVERIFASIERGFSFGDVARTLNAEGVKGRRGKPWVSRTVRTIVHNTAYKGERGYPAIVEPERFDAVHAGLTRLDPVTLAKRSSGRRPRDDSYVLRGVAFCRGCGATMYTRRQAVGRVYVCRNRRQATGLCDASPVLAVLIEGHVLRHLNLFIGSVEEWIAEQLDEHDVERERLEAACDRARRERDEAFAMVQKAERRYLAALDTDDEGMVGDALRTARGELEQAEQHFHAVEAQFSE